MAILPEFRRKNGLSLLLGKLIDECKKKGIDKIAMHARVSNGLSATIQKHFKVVAVRRIDNWKYYNYAESADYIEVLV